MADLNFNPNARYDHGPSAAGCGRAPLQAVLNADSAVAVGLETDGVLHDSHLRVGLNAAGVPRNNIGPNAAGQPRSVNGT